MSQHKVKETSPAVAPNHDAGVELPHEIPGGHPMEIWISYVLRIGVLLAGFIILVGVGMFLVNGAPNTHSLNDVLGHGGHTVTVSPRTIANGIADGDAIAVIQLGVLVLILTPTMRVLMTVFLFMAQQDKAFVVITVIVFLVLIIGLIGVDKGG